MRSIRYITQGIPTCFADCLDRSTHYAVREVSVELSKENEIGESLIVLRLLARFTWVFDDRTVSYSEIMGGIVEGEEWRRQKRSLANANRRLTRRFRDFEEAGLRPIGTEMLFHYGGLVSEREDLEISVMERIAHTMRDFYRSFPKYRFEKRKLIYLLLGLLFFFVIYFMPPWQTVADPAGEVIQLSREGKGAIAVFAMAVIWWVFEAVPIGVTTIAIGISQALFGIRPYQEAFRDFMDPSVLFIFGSIMLGLAFAKTGLAKRLACGMLKLVGERTALILLGSFVLVAALSHFMAHTAAAATVFPLLTIIHAFYAGDRELPGAKPTRFGKALFIGMAYAAGAGSIVTFLGSARGVAAAGLFARFTGKEINFFELAKYMFPLGWVMVLLVWLLMMLFFRPEKRRIAGLRDKVVRLFEDMGPPSMKEKVVLGVTGGVVFLMILSSLVPSLHRLDRTSLMLIAILCFFLFGILTAEDLRDIPWNILLLFAGAMSLSFCLWKTGAARWIAVRWLVMFESSPWLLFVLGVAILVMILTNFIMNVAAISISLPISLAVAGYLGVAPEVVIYASLVTAGMPFLLIIGAPPNAIAFASKQFKPGTFFLVGLPASLLLLGLLVLALNTVWPFLGMPTLVP